MEEGREWEFVGQEGLVVLVGYRAAEKIERVQQQRVGEAQLDNSGFAARGRSLPEYAVG